MPIDAYAVTLFILIKQNPVGMCNWKHYNYVTENTNYVTENTITM